MKPILTKIGNVLFKGYLVFVLCWVTLALSFDLFMIGVHFTDEDLERKIANEITWKIDGRFKDNPENIWYEGK
jgi:hypothetical protein